MTIQEKLEQLSIELKMPSSKIQLIAVTKYASDEQVLEAYQAGLRDFGENYVQAALEKMQRLNNYFTEGEVKWHLLGKLQSNKVNKAVGKFSTIQSVHSLEIAQAINRRAEELGIKQKIFLQINMTGDKNGFDPKSSTGTFLEVFKLANLELLGLMTMGIFVKQEENYKEAETIYTEMRQLKRILESELEVLGMCRDLELSMGMSHDYRIAVKNGSTLIRLGRKLFD